MLKFTRKEVMKRFGNSFSNMSARKFAKYLCITSPKANFLGENNT